MSPVVSSEKAYLFGGRDGRFAEGYRYHPELHELTIQKRVVNTLRTAPVTRMRSQDKLNRLLGGASNTNTSNQSVTHYYWDTIETTGIKPPPSIFVSITAVQNALVVFGGQDDTTVFNTPYILDLGTKAWKIPTTTGTPPEVRFSHYAAVAPGANNANKLLVFGGTSPKGLPYNDLHILDLDTLTWTQPTTTGTPPSARDDLIVSVLGDRLWVFAGKGNHPAEFHSLDFNTFEWRVEEINGEAPPCRRGASATAIFNRYLIVYGGLTETQIYDDTFIYDTVTQLWHKPRVGAYIPQPRVGHCAAVLGNMLYIFGGETVEQDGEMGLLDDLDSLDLSSLEH